MVVHLSQIAARSSKLCSTLLLSGAARLWGCDASPPEPNEPASAAERKASRPASPSSGGFTIRKAKVARLPAPERLVAIGDLHGDLAATRDVLRLAGATDSADHWIGGSLVVVQTGDQIDRGDQDKEVLDLLERLTSEAEAAGGALYLLNGNHETMNALGDFRYITKESLRAFESADTRRLPATVKQAIPKAAHARARAFLPGGSYAKRLAQRPVVLIVGDSVFVHGGVLPAHVDYGLDRLNDEVARWLEGEGPVPKLITDQDGPVWTRLYSEPAPAAAACKTLEDVLGRLVARRMVVGHTVQRAGISSACREQVFRIDVGMSAHYGGDGVAALEIRGQQTKVLQGKKSPAAAAAE